MDPIAPVSDRYCDHMNRDHADAVLYYVQYFAKIPRAKAARMLSVDSKGINISYRTSAASSVELNQRCRVDIDPPLRDPGDGRTRLIELYYQAMEGLGLSKYKADVYGLPDAGELFLFTLSIFTYWLFLSSESSVHSAHPLLLSLRRSIPWPLAIFIMVLIPVAHTGETIWLIRPQLRRYHVSRANRIKWYLHGLGGGAGAWAHFTRLARVEVRRQEAEEKAKGKAH